MASVVEESFDAQGMTHLIFDIDDLTWRRLRAQMRNSGCQAMDAPPTIPADG
jgi:GTP-binding protein HflX